jgi:hypothetical protein
MRNRFSLIFVALAGFALFTGPPAMAEQFALAPATFRESYSRSVDVAGEVFVGASLGAAATSASINELTVFGVRPEDSKLCVTVTSVDGRYRSSMSVPLAQRSGTVLVQFPTRYRTELAALGAQSVAPLARVVQANSTCEQARGELLLASWARAPSGAALTLYANSLQSRMTVRVETVAGEAGSAGAIAASSSCAPINGVTVAFDTRCALAPPAGSQAGKCGSSVLVANRRQGGARFTDRISVRWPCDVVASAQ